MAKIFNLRIWILILVLVASIFTINPQPFAEGIEVNSIDASSELALQGLAEGQKIISVNDVKITTLAEFKDSLNYLEKDPIDLKIKTDKNEYEYPAIYGFGFEVDENLTVVAGEYISIDEQIQEINGIKIGSSEELDDLENELLPKQTLVIETSEGRFGVLVSGKPEITAREARKTNLIKGLELAGGTRVLVRPVSNQTVEDSDIEKLIDVMEERLNLYGLTDVRFKTADVEGEKFILVEMAGVSEYDIKDLIGEQGVFEAKIGDDVVFRGGKGDIPFVCRDDGSCEIIPSPNRIAEDQYETKFDFSIKLSEDAAERQYNVIREVGEDPSSPGYLSKSLDLYVDGKKVSSLRISKTLAQGATQNIAISGPGYGSTGEEAVEDALQEMRKLQTILLTGSLPVKLEFAKFDTVSPVLGQSFVRNAFLVAISAIIGVALVIYFRYRNFKILIPVMITSISEIIAILGFAALFEWNLDLVAIAGILAAVGTGVDDQIVITDEILRKEGQYYNWKQRIKRAFFIIMSAWATTVFAMIPLWYAGAGLVKGFATVTIVGVTVGVLVTRPAFAAMAEKLLNK